VSKGYKARRRKLKNHDLDNDRHNKGRAWEKKELRIQQEFHGRARGRRNTDAAMHTDHPDRGHRDHDPLHLWGEAHGAEAVSGAESTDAASEDVPTPPGIPGSDQDLP